MQEGGERGGKERHLTLMPTADTEPSKPEEAGEGESLFWTRTRAVGARGSCEEKKGQRGTKRRDLWINPGVLSGERTSTGVLLMRERQLFLVSTFG